MRNLHELAVCFCSSLSQITEILIIEEIVGPHLYFPGGKINIYLCISNVNFSKITNYIRTFSFFLPIDFRITSLLDFCHLISAAGNSQCMAESVYSDGGRVFPL